MLRLEEFVSVWQLLLSSLHGLYTRRKTKEKSKQPLKFSAEQKPPTQGTATAERKRNDNNDNNKMEKKNKQNKKKKDN